MKLEFPTEFDGKELIQEITKFDGNKEFIRYKLGKLIGKGGFSIFYKCCCIKNNKMKICAAKEIEIVLREKLENEILICKNLEHKNIVKLNDYFIYNKKYYLIFEYCENKDLSSLLKNRGKLTEIEVQYYIYQLIQALIYLQERNIIHRDLKLQNIFLTEKMELKLGDFALARKLKYSNEKLYDFAGTLLYMAPELIEHKPYTLTADIWALGVIIYLLLIGNIPFNCENYTEIEEKIKNVNYDFPENAIISNAAKDLIKQILVKDPKQRPNLYQILEHDFFKLGKSIPPTLPDSFLETPPSLDYIRTFMEDADEDGIVNREVTTKNLKDIQIVKNIENNKKNNDMNKPDIYVVKYRIIKKWGLGYQLNNNSFGFYFNDNSKIIQNKNNTNKFYYIENKEDAKDYKINESDIPNDVEKKYNILLDFIHNFREQSISSLTEQNEEKSYHETNYNELSLNYPIYVKKYYTYDNESILLMLNNKIIQLYFLNGEIILFSKEKREITFIKNDNKGLEKLNYSFDEIKQNKNFELIQKLQYIKSLLETILTKGDEE